MKPYQNLEGKVFQKQCGHDTIKDVMGEVKREELPVENGVGWKIETTIPVCGECSEKYQFIGIAPSSSFSSFHKEYLAELLAKHP